MPKPKESPKNSKNSDENDDQNEERDRFEEAIRAIFSVPFKPKQDPRKKDDPSAESSSSQ